MNIVIAPDSFKESMTAAVAANAIQRGLQSTLPDARCVCLPMADGGEGSAATLLAACGGTWRKVRVHDPLMRPIDARYAVLDDGRVVVEMAEAAGLQRLNPAERNPALTTTFGVGELMRDALQHGAEQIILAIGGSATNDGGVGMLRALGYRFYDKDGAAIGEGGTALAALHTIDDSDADPRLKQCAITVACDVNNPLCGANGASRVFAAQKGANGRMTAQLDDALRHFADVSAAFLQRDERNVPGAGAAGGMGFALLAFLRATLQRGVDLLAAAVGLDAAVQRADVVITGEGRMDVQTASGKVAHGVLRHAQRYHVPVIALVGSLEDDARVLADMGFAAVLPIVPASLPLAELLIAGERHLQRTAEQVGALLSLGATLR